MNTDEYPPLWSEIWCQYYQVCLQDFVLNRLVTRWFHIDIIFRYVIAITASGSAISGWILWQYPTGKTAWAILSSFSALISTFTIAIPVSNLIRDGISSYSETITLKNRFEILILEYKMDKGKNEESYKKELSQLMGDFTKVCKKTPWYPFVTPRFIERAKRDLNKELGVGSYNKDRETSDEREP